MTLLFLSLAGIIAIIVILVSSLVALFGYKKMMNNKRIVIYGFANKFSAFFITARNVFVGSKSMCIRSK